MFGRKKKTILNATCVMELNENHRILLKAMQMNHPIPDGANYIAFLEDGDACFLEELPELDPRQLLTQGLPKMMFVSYRKNILIDVS